MDKKQSKCKKWFLIGGIAAVFIIAVAVVIVVWCMQIRLTPPANVSVGDTGIHTAQVKWDAVEDATSYAVCLYEEEGKEPLAEQQTDTTEILLEGLQADREYELSVTAIYEKKDKHIESEPSETVAVRTAAPEPGNVTGLQAEGKDTVSISVQWTPYETEDANADGSSVAIHYTVLYSSTEDGTYKILAEDLVEPEYLHEDIEELDTYYYKVIVQEQMDGNDYLGSESETSVSGTTAVGMVAGLTAEGISDSKIELSWDAYPMEKLNGDGTPVALWYTVYGAESEDSEFTVLADELTDTLYNEESLAPETTRYYKVVVTVQKDGDNIVGAQTEAVSATTQKKAVATVSGGGTGAGASSADAQKDAQARAVAQQIADSITGNSDLEKIRQAAQIVAAYCYNATYTTEDPDYRTAYGVFCKGVYTCAGSTRALGMVLECMGYSWEHVNANQWSHQWCRVTMDGQIGWADGMGGIADYGESPFASGGTYTDQDGTIYFVP